MMRSLQSAEQQSMPAAGDRVHSQPQHPRPALCGGPSGSLCSAKDLAPQQLWTHVMAM